MYVTSKLLLENARIGGYAVAACNFENMEMAMAIVAAAEKLRAPVILQTTPSTVKYACANGYTHETALNMFRSVAEAAAGMVKVPVACHLDHGDSAELAIAAVDAGYSSVMIDGSKLPYDENIAVVRKVTEYAAARGIPVEAELGTVGGKEDDLVAGDAYTDPAAASDFVIRTGVDSLAVAIGTAHGIYKGVPVLDVGRLSEIRHKLDADGTLIPLVLHGASGLSEEAICDCIRRGICKVNFATELRQAFTSAVREFLAADGGVYDPKKYGKAAMAAVAEQAGLRMKSLGSAGKY